MDFNERSTLNDTRTAVWCETRGFNSMMTLNRESIKHYQRGLAKQLDPLYAKIRDLDMQFSLNNVYREHHKLSAFTKPQIQLLDEEINKENPNTIMNT